MKLRIARKIVKAVGGPRESAYTPRQKKRALNRVDRTADARRDREFVNALMLHLGPVGRAELLARTGAPGMALDLLLRTPEERWRPKPEDVEAFDRLCARGPE